jgi:Flp pilus assembly protein TadD
MSLAEQESRDPTQPEPVVRWWWALPGLAILFLLIIAIRVYILPDPSQLSIDYPFDGSVFPPEIIPPAIWWEESGSSPNRWRVSVTSDDGTELARVEVDTTAWIPDAGLWESIKEATLERPGRLTVESFVHFAGLKRRLSTQSIFFSTSRDSVGSPIFYRDVPLPFDFAVEHVSTIRWRLGNVGSEETPPVVLADLPVCGNCHSFSADGRTLGMDVDVANDKGAYILTSFDEETTFTREKIFSWHDYRDEDPPLRTFGLLARVSPDGRYVVGAIKDRAVFLPRPDLTFSQLFFPVRSSLAYYDSRTGRIRPLQGADDDRYVQANAVWAPDGQHITFARGTAPTLRSTPRDPGTSLTREEAAELLGGEEFVDETKEGYTKFLYDLYTLPFNEGEGGLPVPLEGASRNGRSNYFPKYSPDGKWLVFNQAESFMLLMPDSRLYIMAAEGGEPRLMNCNTESMNSWHSWSPNSRWLVFTSKVFSPYTQLFLTHVDETGMDTPPVLLRNFMIPERAINIPEFTNIEPDARRVVYEMFVDDYNYLRRGMRLEEFGRVAEAEEQYLRALEMNPTNTEARYALALSYANRGSFEEAEAEFRVVLELDPGHVLSMGCLGGVYAQQGRFQAAIQQYLDCLEHTEGQPEFEASIRLNLGMVYFQVGDHARAEEEFLRVLEVEPENVDVYLALGNIKLTRGDTEGAVRDFEKVLEMDPANDALRERIMDLRSRGLG